MIAYFIDKDLRYKWEDRTDPITKKEWKKLIKDGKVIPFDTELLNHD